MTASSRANSTYRSNTSTRDSGRDTTFDTDIAAIPDQRQILLDEQEARSLPDHPEYLQFWAPPSVMASWWWSQGQGL